MARPRASAPASPNRAWLVTIPLFLFAAAITLPVVRDSDLRLDSHLIGDPFTAGLLCVLLVLYFRFFVNRGEAAP